MASMSDCPEHADDSEDACSEGSIGFHDGVKYEFLAGRSENKGFAVVTVRAIAKA